MKDDKLIYWKGYEKVKAPCPGCFTKFGEKHKPGCTMRRALLLQELVGQDGYPKLTLKECEPWLKKFYEREKYDIPIRQLIPKDAIDALIQYGLLKEHQLN